jgi:outer membrane protein assembly factor BamB
MTKRIRPIAAGLAVAALVAAACAPSSLPPSLSPTLIFPLAEEIRLSCRGPLVPKLVAGPGGLVLVTTTTGYLQAVDLEQQARRWEFLSTSAEVAPVVAGDRIIFAAGDGKIYGLNPAGKAVWERKPEEPIQGEPLLVGNQMVYREGKNFLAALNPADGAPLWRVPASAQTDPAAWGDRIVFGTTDGLIKILSPDGRNFRNYLAGGKPVGRLGVNLDDVYLNLDDGRFNAYDLSTGKNRWSVRFGGAPVGPPATDGRTLYTALSNNIVAALNPKRGDLYWWRPLSGRASFPPLILNNHVLVVSRSAVLQAFAETTGKAEVAFEAGGALLAPVLVAGPRLCLAVKGDTEGLSVIIVLRLAPPVAETTAKKNEGEFQKEGEPR